MYKSLKDKIKNRIVSEYRRLFPKDHLEENRLREVICQILFDFANDKRDPISVPEPDKQKIITDLINDFIGFGPIEDILKDPEVTEIMINGPKKVYVEKNGIKQISNVKFDDDQHIMYMISKVLSPTRRRVDETSPFADAALKDGSRINVIIPPVSVDWPCITIRKFSENFKKIEDLIAMGTLDHNMANFLIGCIKAKANIIFSGATGVGKTTTLNVLSSYLGEHERIITIEDTVELKLAQEHVVRLETKPPSIEGKGEITMRDLFKNSLRMRPERIILGEIRGAEALDLLQAMCSGHSGCLAVLHANTPQNCIYRLETMILTSGLPINLEAIHRQIATAINFIVQHEQLPDGSRKIVNITEIRGLKNGLVELEDIFVFETSGMLPDGKVFGNWKPTGVVPLFDNSFKKAGVFFPEQMFTKE